MINGVLDRTADRHRTKWGCWYNRDIRAIIANSGLRVQSTSRWHFGTTHLIVGTPVDATTRDELRRRHEHHLRTAHQEPNPSPSAGPVPPPMADASIEWEGVREVPPPTNPR